MDFTKLYINGEWISPLTKEFIEVIDPANEEIIGKVPRSGEEDVNLAVKSAKEALEEWQDTAPEERIKLVQKLSEEMEKRAEEFSDMIVKELGRGKKFALDYHTLPYIEDTNNFIKIAKSYEFEENFGDYLIRKEPVGVVAALTPWNYPLGQITSKVIPALLAGNTLVLKPSQQTPMVAYILADAVHSAGFPKGVFNLVTGAGSEVGNILTEHPDVNMVTFTGSTKSGREVAKKSMGTVKRITLELGGKSPAIILKGADLENALKRTLNSVYNNTGQTCSAYTRLLVHEDEREAIEKAVVEMTAKYKFGDPKASPTNIGPLVSENQYKKVKAYIEKGLEEGARLIYGEIPEKKEKGYYVNPVVFTDVSNDMTIAREEIFGPVLSIISYKDEADAVKIANDTEYGLAAAVFGPEKEARAVARKLKAGNVQVNKGRGSNDAPFGGFKQSGLGREGGVYGLEEFLEIKAIFE